MHKTSDWTEVYLNIVPEVLICDILTKGLGHCALWCKHLLLANHLVARWPKGSHLLGQTDVLWTLSERGSDQFHNFCGDLDSDMEIIERLYLASFPDFQIVYSYFCHIDQFLPISPQNRGTWHHQVSSEVGNIEKSPFWA